MAHVHRGRFTAEVDRDEVVVFLIGMRINRPWRVQDWVPIGAAMPRMLRELDANPQLGLLGRQQWFGRTTLMVQYWESFEHLDAYARAADHEHLPAWRDFNRRVADSASVGIWHETYVVPRSGLEAVYGNMPVFGLAAATRHVPATGDRRSALTRLGRADPAPPEVPSY